MLARVGTMPADLDAWAFEVKWDGLRAIAEITAAGVVLRSRTLRDITATYPELARLPDALAGHPGTVCDGEIIAADPDGRPSFSRLAERMNVGTPDAGLIARTPVRYIVFDLLVLDGEDLCGRPYRERRAGLESLELSEGPWQVPPVYLGAGPELLEATRRRGLEGVIAKRLDAPYRPGTRSANWLKFKHRRREQLVVGGFLPERGAATGPVGALLVGHFEKDALIYDGRVGTGWDARGREELTRRLAGLVQPESPFRAPPRLRVAPVYVTPELVVEVSYLERTAAGRLRAAVFCGIEPDASADGPESLRLVRDGSVAVAGRQLRLTNTEKVIYPETGFTKGDLIAYYAAISPAVLPHLRGRALTLKRYPDGVDAPFFYEKQAPGHRPAWVATVTVGALEYTLVHEPATLIWLANLADVELHTPLALADAPDTPTAVVFDLDPGDGAGLLDCAEVAVILRELFDHYGLDCRVKTSGAKGMQVYVPLNDPHATFAETKAFARRVAESLAGRLPDLVVASMTRSARTGRVLIDWSQNDAHKTTVTVYSLRATPHPFVSTPLDWAELEAARAARDPRGLRFSPREVEERVSRYGDLFRAVLDAHQTLPRLT